MVANLVSVFLGIILLPVYTRFLTPTDYGIVSIAASITSFLSAFYVLGLTNAYGRFYFDFKHDTRELKRHISTIVLFLTAYGLLLSLLITFSGRGIERFTPGVPFSPYIILAVWSSYLALLFQLRLQLYQIEQKAKQYATLLVVNIIVQSLLTIFFVVLLKKGALGYITAGLVSNFVFSLVSFWLLRSYLRPVIDTTKLKVSLRYGLPLVPHILGGWMMALADRIILNRLVDTAEAGLYSVAYTLGTGMNLVSMSINYAWAPFFMSQMKDRGDAAKVEIARFATYWVGAMCFVFLLISLFSREILAVLTASQYHVAYRVVPLIALGYLFTGFYYVVVNPLFWLGRTPLIAVGTITGGLLNVGLNFLFVPHMQMMGSALATALSNLYVFVFIAFFSLRLFSLPYEYKRLGIIIAATTLCYLLSIPAGELASIWIVLASKFVIVCMFPLLLLLMGFLKIEEKKALKAVFVAAVSRVRNSTKGLFRP